ncbi:MAG: Bacterial hemoglobin [Pseudomonadota bacterium]|jgi:hemoglobin-like flavoprotein
MNAEHIKAVQQSWALLEPVSDQAAELFYTNLFARNPGMRALFTEDLSVQGRQLMRMFDKAVASLERPDELVPMLRALGERHRDYGVTAAHFDAYGEALYRTLAQGLGTAFPPEVGEAWRVVFSDIRGVMLGSRADVM